MISQRSNTSRVLLLLVLLVSRGNGQTHELSFQRFSIEDGLSSNTVYCIQQDHLGFLWFGTEDGLNRYDGYDFKVFRHEQGNLNSLSGYAVSDVFEDEEGILWIGTREGLNMFDPSTETFTHFKADPGTPGSISNNFIEQIKEDNRGNLWIGTRNGLNMMDRKKGTFSVYKHDRDVKGSISHNTISAILEDRRGNLWIGTINGLNKFNYDDKSFSVYRHDSKNPSTISDNVVFVIFEDSRKDVWIGTRKGLNKLVYGTDSEELQFLRIDNNSDKGNVAICEDGNGALWIGANRYGVSIFDPLKREFETLRHQPDNATSLSHDDVSCLYKDHSGVIWIGTGGKGLNKFSQDNRRFSHYRISNYDQEKKGGGDISSILLDGKGRLWLGAKGDGLYLIEPYPVLAKESKVIQFKLDKQNSRTLSNNHVLSVTEDREGQIWVGTFGGGVNRYDPEVRTLTVYKNNPVDPGSLSSNYVHTILEDRNGDIWIGTGQGGVNKYMKSGDSFISFKHDPENSNSLSTNEVSVIYEDRNGTLWLGTTTGGLNRFDKESGSFIHYKHDPADVRSLSSQRVVSIYQDRSGRLWIGTLGGGLNLYNDQSGTFTHFTTHNGLPGNTITAMVEDTSGNLWLSSDKGVSRFSYSGSGAGGGQSTYDIKNYDVNDGLQGNEFNPQACFFDRKRNLIMFGGTNGLNVFNPDEITENRTLPRIVITDFLIFNRPVMVNGSSGGRSVTFSDEISIPYQDNVFSFEFASLHFSNPTKNQHAYRMEGFDKEWVYSGTRRFVTYTNLDPGEYIFRVKGTNGDGIWNEEGASVQVRINPPYWATWWFRTLSALTVTAGLFMFYRRRVQALEKEKHMQREFSNRLMESQENERKRIAGELHDSLGQNLLVIRNRALLGLKDAALSEQARSQLDQISSVTTQAINEVREIAYDLRPYQLDRLGLTKAITSITSGLATSVQFTMNVDPIDEGVAKDHTIHVYRIVQEGINNILKHAGASEAQVEIRLEEKSIRITITDNGKGMPPEPTAGSDGRQGFGLVGITERAKVLNGTVAMESTPGKGTLLTVVIPRRHVNNPDL